MIALKMVLQIVDGQTNGQTNGHTLVVVKSLPRLKNLVLVSRYLRLQLFQNCQQSILVKGVNLNQKVH